jgi:hypothetical protein
LTLDEFKGSPHACGVAYGQQFATRIVGFCRYMTKPTSKLLGYARRCWPFVERFAPASAQFMRGVAKGARLSLEHVTLVSLHEEVFRIPHCTAFAARGRATVGGKTIVAQNWDWSTPLYPWPGLVRWSMKGAPSIAAYHYPGMWICAGVNEAGLALMWTGGGHFPLIKPRVGLPTYVLIAEILRLTSVPEALRYLQRVEHAGCFIFFLGDASGATGIVEAVPGKTETVNSQDVLSRANHYLCPDILRCGKQKRPTRSPSTTRQRLRRVDELLAKHDGRISPRVARQILEDRGTPWPWLNQWPAARDAKALASMTIDSLVAVCQDRALWTCRGGREPGPWQCVRA